MDHNNSKNVSFSSNGSDLQTAAYIFTPAGSKAKLVLFLPALAAALIGFVGNSLILYFISRKQRVNRIQKSLFTKNLNLYIKSLALSDVLCTAVSFPLTCIQMYFDIFQNSWSCRIVRYFHIVFPVITTNNLVVISLEKHFSLKRVPRTFRVSTVRKLIFLAWVFGCVSTLLPVATFRGIRYDLNNTHFTVVCRYDKEYLPFRLTFLSFIVVEYVLPSILLIAINVSLSRRLWVFINVRSEILRPRNNLTKDKMRGTLLLIVITFAFIIPYFSYLAYVTYNMTAKPRLMDFQTDYVIRYGSGLLGFSNSEINFALYVAQMEDFRNFLRNLFCKSNTVGYELKGLKTNNKASAQQKIEVLNFQQTVS